MTPARFERCTAMATIRKALSSRQGLKSLIQTKEAPVQGTAYFNEDLLPTPPSLLPATSDGIGRSELINLAISGQRTWTALHFLSFYLTMTFSPSSYNLGATLVSLGLVCDSVYNLL